jgi:hypothetical protein
MNDAVVHGESGAKDLLLEINAANEVSGKQDL